jgi:hypothetical protein
MHSGWTVAVYLVGKKLLIISEMDWSSMVITESCVAGMTSLGGAKLLPDLERRG